MSELLRVRREDTLRDVEAMVAAAWQRQPASVRAAIVSQLGIPPGFRNPSASAWPIARGAVRRAIHLATARALAHVLRACFVNDDRALLAQCYRRIDIGTDADPDDTLLAHQAPPPTREQFEAGWASLDDSERPRFLLFVVTVADAGIDDWRGPAAEAMAAVILPAFAPAPGPVAPPAGAPVHGVAADPAPAVPDAGTGTDEPQVAGNTAEGGAHDGEEQVDGDATDDDEQATGAPPAHREPVRLTRLDGAIIDLVVQSIAGQHGAMTPEVMVSVTEELANLSSKRVQSRFHLGFLAALSGGLLPARRPDDNDARRAWAIAGWIMGHHRKDPSTSLDRLAETPAPDREAFLKTRDASEGFANEIVKHLTKVDDRPEVLLDWIGRAGPEGLTHAVRHVEQLHRQDRASDALAICTTLPSAWGHYAEMHGVKSLMDKAFILLAKSHRMMGNFREAEQLLEWINGRAQIAAEPGGGQMGDAAVGHEDPQASVERHHALGLERLLCAMHASHSWDVWMPADKSDRTVLDRLDGCEDIMKRCIVGTVGLPPAGVAYLYGLWCILRGANDVPDGSPDPREVIRRALDGHVLLDMSTKSSNPLNARLKLLDALLSVSDGGARTANAIEAIVQYEAVHGLLPFHAVVQAIECALLFDADQAWQLVLPRFGSDFAQFSELGMLAACLDKPQLVKELIACREELGNGLDGRQRVEMMCGLFKAAADQQLSRDVLTDLADELIMRVSEFTDAAPMALDAMCEKDRWSRVWDEDEFTGIQAGLASWCPEHVRVRVRAKLHQRAVALVRRDPETAVELLELCEVLGEPLESTKATRDLVELLEVRHAAAKQAQPAAVARRVRVLFVGGDERQRNAEAAIRERVISQRASTAVEFMYPGWSANWGHALNSAAAAVDQADIVVMLRFMRTRFGEELRKAINTRGKQWRPTYGHAPPSIARAIVQAANDLAAQGASAQAGR